MTHALASWMPAWAVIALSLVAGALAGALWALDGHPPRLRPRERNLRRSRDEFHGPGGGHLPHLRSLETPGRRVDGRHRTDGSLALDGDARSTDASPTALILAIVAAVFTAVVIQRTHFGLKTRAVGQNLRAAQVLGVPAVRQLLIVFAACGVFAGLAGALQVMAVFHRLIPNVSSNLGYLALLVVMLAGYDMRFVVPIALLFSILNVGSLRLPLTLGLESSLSGVLQGALALVVLLLPSRRKGA